jgi:hypothetical protein
VEEHSLEAKSRRRTMQVSAGSACACTGKKFSKKIAPVVSRQGIDITRRWDGQLRPGLMGGWGDGGGSSNYGNCSISVVSAEGFTPGFTRKTVPNSVTTTKPYRVLLTVGRCVEGQETRSLSSNSYHWVTCGVTC